MAGMDVSGYSSSLRRLLALQMLGIALVCSQMHGDIRLAGYGASSTAGRLEVYYNGEWGTVCWSEYFELISASVACRQLGLGPAVHVVHYPELRYDIGSGPIHLTMVHCQGAESHILRCQHSTETSSCSHHLDVGIECSTNFLPYPGQVRLYGDPAVAATSLSLSSGLLQMFWEGQWKSVCSNEVIEDDGLSACQQLGFTGLDHFAEAESLLSNGWVEKDDTSLDCSNSSEPCFTDCFVPVSGPCSIDAGMGLEIRCKFETNMVDMYLAGNSTCQLATPTGHMDVKMAMVEDTCDDPPCNAYQGIPKVYMEGKWLRVCHGDLANGDVICRQLGFSIAVRYPPSSDVGQGIELKCVGVETHLSECSEPEVHDSCDLVELRCVNGEVPYGSLKLTDSSGSSGVLKIYDQTFRPVCDSGFSMKEAMVVCRQLGYAGVLKVVPNSLYAADEQTVGDDFFSSISCSGDEDYLLDCEHIPVDPAHCHLPYDAIGVQCRPGDYQEGSGINLEPGSGGDGVVSGWLRANISGTWGSVCGVEFDHLDAHVACREMGYATFASFSSVLYPDTTLPISLYTIGCSGFEETLFSCPHTISDVNSSCSHNDDVFLECATELPLQDFEVRLSNKSDSSSTSSASGRLEVVMHGLWMTICGTFFTQADADVACRNLGFSRASSYCTDACYGSGSDYIFFADSRCTGTEATLAECFDQELDLHNDDFCSHSGDVGLACVRDDVPTVSPSSPPVTSPPPDSEVPFYTPLSTVTFYGIVVGAMAAVLLFVFVCLLICCCYCKKRSRKNIIATHDNLGAMEVISTNGVGSALAKSYPDVDRSARCKEKEAELSSQWPACQNGAGAGQHASAQTKTGGVALRSSLPLTDKEDLYVESLTSVTTPVSLEMGCGHPRSRDSVSSALPPSYDELEFTSYPTISRTANHSPD